MLHGHSNIVCFISIRCLSDNKIVKSRDLLQQKLRAFKILFLFLQNLVHNIEKPALIKLYFKTLTSYKKQLAQMKMFGTEIYIHHPPKMVVIS